MSAPLRKLILLLLIACLPLQGLAAGVMALDHGQPATHEMSMQMDAGMAGMHSCCHHGSDKHTPAQHQNTCGDGPHCPLCNVSLAPEISLMPLSVANASLYPLSSPHIALFYPEQPQRPPLVRVS